MKSLRRKLRSKSEKVSHLTEMHDDQVRVLQSAVTNLTNENDSISHSYLKRQESLDKLKDSLTKIVNTLNSRTQRYSTYREKKEAEVAAIEKKAKADIDAITLQHQKEMQREKSRQFVAERNKNKNIVLLQAQIKTVETKAKNEIAANEEDCSNMISKHRYVLLISNFNLHI